MLEACAVLNAEICVKWAPLLDNGELALAKRMHVYERRASYISTSVQRTRIKYWMVLVGWSWS